MLNDALSFPHPVLGLSDDIQGGFSITIDVQRNVENRTIEFAIKYSIIDNNYFSALTQDGRAGILVKVYCSSTFKTWAFINPGDKFEINEDDLCNKVEITPMIIALCEIYDYFDASFNTQFGNQSFFVNKFDILAVTGPITIPIDKEYEKLGLGNIFEFSPEDDHTKPCSFDFNTDKILIKYPITLNGDHPPNALFNKAAWASYNIFIIPAVTEAFKLIGDKDKRKGFEDYEWFYVLNSLLPEDERDDDPFKNAQLILNREIPVLKAFDELCNN